jgi:hypothetical protein
MDEKNPAPVPATANISLDAETYAFLERRAQELARLTGGRPNFSAAVRSLVLEAIAEEKAK